MARKMRTINPKAKKWSKVIEKQKRANKMLDESRNRLGREHNAQKRTREKIRTFYQQKGVQHRGRYLSAKGLTPKDMADYETLLDSIINDTYINEDKYNKLHKDNIDRLIENGLADDEKTANAIFDIMGDIRDQLIEMGVPFSDFADYYNQAINEYNIDDEQFRDIFEQISKAINEGIIDSSQFFDIADKYLHNYERINGVWLMGIPRESIIGTMDYVADSDEWGKMLDDFVRQFENGVQDIQEYIESRTS